MASSSAATVPERRDVRRHAYDRDLFCGLLPTYETFWATGLDLSPVGVGLLADRALQPDDRLAVELSNPGRTFAITREARVVRCAPLLGAHWVVGCVLEPGLSEAELRALL